jgi:hypothetical protein
LLGRRFHKKIDRFAFRQAPPFRSRLACDELSRVEAVPTYSSSICGSGFQPREIHYVEWLLFFSVFFATLPESAEKIKPK